MNSSSASRDPRLTNRPTIAVNLNTRTRNVVVLKEPEVPRHAADSESNRALQITVTVPVLLDLLLCHSRAWLPREESRSLPHVLQRNSGFLARARHARGNDRKIRPNGRACHYLVQDSNKIPRPLSCGRGQAARRLRVFATAVTRG